VPACSCHTENPKQEIGREIASGEGVKYFSILLLPTRESNLVITFSNGQVSFFY